MTSQRLVPVPYLERLVIQSSRIICSFVGCKLLHHRYLKDDLRVQMQSNVTQAGFSRKGSTLNFLTKYRGGIPLIFAWSLHLLYFFDEYYVDRYDDVIYSLAFTADTRRQYDLYYLQAVPYASRLRNRERHVSHESFLLTRLPATNMYGRRS